MRKFRKSMLIIGIVVVIMVMIFIFFYEKSKVFEVTNYVAQTNLIEETNQTITTKISLKEYDILFYGNQKFYMNFKGEKIELREGLINKTISVDKMLEQAEQDSKNNIASRNLYLDGGSIQYIYDDFSIIKMHSLNGNRNVYIGENLDIDNL